MKKAKNKVPNEGPKPHGATGAPRVVDYGKDWPYFAVEFPTTVACDNHKYPVHYYQTEDIRKLGEWCLKVADWIDKQQ